MHKTHPIIGLFFCLPLALLATGCMQDEIDGCPGTTPTGSGATSYVTLRFTMASPSAASRAEVTPNPGETGDGYETGQTEENKVMSAVAFLYKDEKGVDGNALTPVTAIYFDSVKGPTESTATAQTTTHAGGVEKWPVDATYSVGPQAVTLDNGDYHVIVVANPDIDSNDGSNWWDGGNLTLGTVRDHIQKHAWKETKGNNQDASSEAMTYSDFLMSSEGDAPLTLTSNPKEDPATATVNVERMAARIDYKVDYNSGTSGTNTSFAIIDDKNTKIGSVTIDGACIVNDFTAGSYLLKRVADDVNGTNLQYLGIETAADAATSKAANYVMDPWTKDKTSTNASSGTPFTVDGNSCAASGLYGTYYPGQAQNTDPSWWAEKCTDGTSLTDNDNVTWHRIGYTLENTTDKDQQGYTYNTAVVFKATFTPADGKIAGSYKDKATFFSYNGRLYATMEDMMKEFYGDNWSTKFNPTTIWNSAEDLKKFYDSETSAVHVDPSGYFAYLTSFLPSDGGEDGNDSKANWTAPKKWTDYMKDECGYTKDAEKGVQLNQNAKQTRDVLKTHGVSTYIDGQCYYTWLVKHANDGNPDKYDPSGTSDETTTGTGSEDAAKSTGGVMEYAIVRNNVYKLNVKSVSGLGGDIPGDNPDHKLIVHVTVKPWTLLPAETLPM